MGFTLNDAFAFTIRIGSFGRNLPAEELFVQGEFQTAVLLTLEYL